MTIAKGVDYAFSPHPRPDVLKNEGYSFACRYLSPNPANDSNGKNLSSGELSALMGAGLAVVVVEESTAQRMLQGHAAGVSDAQHAAAVTRSLGISSIPVYFACDFDATEADQVPVNDYLDGAASVIGLNRTGIYGGYWPVKRAFDAGKVKWGWQAFAWSGGNWDARAQLRQVQNGVIIGGADCDVDEAHAEDFGQWPRKSANPGPPVVTTPSYAQRWPENVELYQGVTGHEDAVAAMQQLLHNCGKYGARGLAVDGIFGPGTYDAVRNYQNGTPPLKVDGIAGPKTRAALLAGD